VSHPIFIHKVK